MSAGELEHEWAGTPGRLIRERYRRAAEITKVRGKLSCLVINDIDAGLGACYFHVCSHFIALHSFKVLFNVLFNVQLGSDPGRDMCAARHRPLPRPL